jgi:FAD/FMN-containing dehydrogenase/Fe-S oxidoreductase
MSSTEQDLRNLEQELQGELKWDRLHQSLYATDASVYRKMPLAVSFPKNKQDLIQLIKFAREKKIGLIPRTAGTSLAGQCVGEGIVVDTSKHFTRILAFDERNKTIKVEPGVIRDDLNEFLKPFGLFFGPNTSTSNRCMIGGMVGNNSSGTTSIQYGVTRDKVLEMTTLLSDGSQVVFGALNANELRDKMQGSSLESRIYSTLHQELSKPEVREEIRREFPKPEIHRRNNGYAIDALLETEVFSDKHNEINLSKLLCGSEGTLAFTLDTTLQLNDLPPDQKLLVAAHFESIEESMKAVVPAMKHELFMCELMDKTILDCTKNNREQSQNRFFIEGDPRAVLMMEVCANTGKEVEAKALALISELKNKNLGYAYPILRGDEIRKAFNLRKAGLGLLGNIVGDRKAVACIEDTAVALEDLPSYIAEFTAMMKRFGQEAVYYAHAGAGELHLRPILDLKKSEDIQLFRQITAEVADLVKKYRGSMSGEHGDGIVRSEFLPKMIGNKNYGLVRQIKSLFDPVGIFNPGKIVDPWPMDKSLRYTPDRKEPDPSTIMDFSDSLGILRAAEKCNGSGDCRKSIEAGGTMCPSYRATKDEKDTTRARANALREFLTNNESGNPFDHEELKMVFDLCLSCKACASECPSNVDVAALKAEFLYQYQSANGIPLRSRLFGDNVKYNKLGSKVPWLTNTLLNMSVTKRLIGVATERSIPKLKTQTTRKWFRKNIRELEKNHNKSQEPLKELYLFLDEFTDYYDSEVGRDCIELLHRLGYRVIVTQHAESGRSLISKGMLDKAKVVIDENIQHFKYLVSKEKPLVGIEPSAILGFRDEYLRLADDKEAALEISKCSLTIEEFFQKEIQAGNIRSVQFTDERKTLKIHGHCHQKSLSDVKATFDMLNLPANYEVSILNTGCCGMAGSFGYEKEHYAISMKVGEDTLFPKVRAAGTNVEIAAAGTSCRHQIKDGTGTGAHHPVSLMRRALK